MNNPNSHIDYWVACSGGLDSVSLVHILMTSKVKIGILHCNFQLRGEESNQDAAFVSSLAQELGIPFQIKLFNTNEFAKTNKVSIQEAARKLRYDWFADVYQETQKKVVLAHHFDDQVETFIIQLLRGGSVRGLSCMPSEREGIIRPLLHVRRKTLEALCLKNNWLWREDSSNSKTVYQRNFIRLELIPELINIGVSVDEIYQLVEHFQKLNAFTSNVIIQLPLSFPQTWFKSDWEKLPHLIKKEVLRRTKIDEKFLSNIEELFDAVKGAKLVLNEYTIITEDNGIVILPNDEQPPNIMLKYDIVKSVDQSDLYNANYLFVDADKVKLPLQARRPRNGDRFSPIGMKGTKLVSDFLKDRKISHLDRAKVTVIEDANQIIGLLGLSPHDAVKISKDTKQILRIFVEDVTS